MRLSRSMVLAVLLAGIVAHLVAAPPEERLGASIFVQTTEPTAALVAKGTFWFDTTGNVLKVVTGMGPTAWTSIGAGVPVGSILLVASGSCPAGYAEASALDGKFLLGTIAANGNVGTTGGADTITPAGSNSAPVFTGSSANTSAVSAGTPAGTNGAVAFTPAGTVTAPTVSWPAGVPTFAGSTLAAHAHELPWQIPSTTTIRQIAIATFGTGTSRAATAVSAAGTANTTSAAVALSEAKSAGTPAGTVAWPAGVPTATVPTFTGSSGTVPAETFTGNALGTHLHAATATGTVAAPVFTGAQFDNRPAFARIIACVKA